MTLSEITSGVAERPALFIPIQLSQLSICAACRLKARIWIGLYFTPSCKEQRIFRNRINSDDSFQASLYFMRIVISVDL